MALPVVYFCLMRHGHVVIDRSIPAMQAWRKLPEGTLAEVINDRLYVSPSPTPYHQSIGLTIKINLANFVLRYDLGIVYDAPIDLFLEGNASVLMPDILFVAKENSLSIDRKGLHGVPDLLIEILSPSTRKRNLSVKKGLYEKAGVKEYWLVDPDIKDARGYLLQNNRYSEPLMMKSQIHIRILDKMITF